MFYILLIIIAFLTLFLSLSIISDKNEAIYYRNVTVSIMCNQLFKWSGCDVHWLGIGMAEGTHSEYHCNQIYSPNICYVLF